MADRPERVIPEKFKGRKIYSISRLTSFNNCEYGYFLNYHLKKKGKPNIYSLLGSKVHSILEDLQSGNIDKHKGLENFKIALLETSDILGYKFASDKIHTNFVQSIEHFIMNFKPIDAKNVAMEKEFYTEVGGAVLIGFIDVVAQMQDDTIEVIDYKTSSKYASKDLDEHGLQLVLYAMALEQEFGVKVSRVKWNMLKYCKVQWQGATKPREGFYLRAELVKKLRTELKKDLRNEGLSDSEMEILLAQAEESNDMTLFSKAIQDKYVISDGYVEYELSEKTRANLEKFVSEMVAKIESKDPKNELEWSTKDIASNSFFCATLCDHKGSCQSYIDFAKQFDEGNKVSAESIVQKQEDEMKKLFG